MATLKPNCSSLENKEREYKACAGIMEQMHAHTQSLIIVIGFKQNTFQRCVCARFVDKVQSGVLERTPRASQVIMALYIYDVWMCVCVCVEGKRHTLLYRLYSAPV